MARLFGTRQVAYIPLIIDSIDPSFKLLFFKVIISNTGNVIGISRKNHIPRVGDFNEVA